MSSSRFSSKTFATDAHQHALLTPDEMARVDQQAIERGTPGFQLMESAGQAVVVQILRRWTVRTVCVVCGPGNNGGDGFVVARILHEHGWPVRVGLLGDVSQLQGEAREHAALWSGHIEPLSPGFIDGADLIVDALFGTGLSRPVDGALFQLLQRICESGIPVCAVDIPSGIDGSTGRVLGAAVQADVTVTFHRKKPGQLLLPGRQYCGELVVADIGIPETIVSEMNINVHENHPSLWRDRFPWPQVDQHKYMRGHVLIRGGDTMTGAARLTAMAAARTGAGLVSVAASPASWPVYAAALTSIMVLPCDGLQAWQTLLSDRRRNVTVIGPGAGAGDTLRDDVLTALSTRRAVVLDADALSVFSGQATTLFQAIRGPCVLTPHSGEFARLFAENTDPSAIDSARVSACVNTSDQAGRATEDGFPQAGKLARSGKLELTRAAARLSGAVVVLKGADTVVAAPDGRAVINTNAPPELATGGSGDVLAGIIAGLIAQGMEPFDATAAAVWMHGQAATLFGPGLIAEDLPQMLIPVLCELRDSCRNE